MATKLQHTFCVYSSHSYHCLRDNLHSYKGVAVQHSVLQENKEKQDAHERERTQASSFPTGLSFPHCVRDVNKGNAHLVTADSKGHFTKNEHTDTML